MCVVTARPDPVVVAARLGPVVAARLGPVVAARPGSVVVAAWPGSVVAARMPRSSSSSGGGTDLQRLILLATRCCSLSSFVKHACLWRSIESCK